jgi:protein PsiE
MKDIDGQYSERDLEQRVSVSIIRVIERVFLVLIIIMALMGTVDEILLIYTKMSVNLADVLLMFLYLEIVGMVSIYYQNRRAAFVYPIYIAITALTRLIILQGKEITPENILFEAIAILLLALAALLIVRTNAN